MMDKNLMIIGEEIARVRAAVASYRDEKVWGEYLWRLADSLHAAIEIMGQLEPGDEHEPPHGKWCLHCYPAPVCSHGEDAYCTNCRPAPEPEEPLDTRVCRALGKHRTDRWESCHGPSGDKWFSTCFPWSSSELGVGTMLAWLHDNSGIFRYLEPTSAGWVVHRAFRPALRADTPQAALANAVAAVGERDAS